MTQLVGVEVDTVAGAVVHLQKVLAVALCAALAMFLDRFGFSRELCSSVATVVAWFVGFLVLLRTCLPLNRNRTFLLIGIAVAFAAVMAVAGHHFALVPFTGTAWIALLALSGLGAAVVFGTAAFLRRKKWDS